MMAKPAIVLAVRALSTTLSGWRMCDLRRDAPHAGRKPVSTHSRAIIASSAASGAWAGSRWYSCTTLSIARRRPVRALRARRGARTACIRSSEGVEHLLHVLVLLEAIDHRQDLGGLLLRQLRRHGADVLVLRRQRRETARFQCLLQPAEIGKGSADHQLRFAFFARALAHLVEPVIDEVQLEVILVDAFWVQAKHSHLAEQETEDRK